MKAFKFVYIVIVFVLLTLLTQIGGLVYLLSFTIYGLINRKVPNTALRSIVKIISFLVLYSVATFLIVPVISLFAERPVIGKLFIEPHLKTRLKLTSNKIRFHGCQAVRHDDHMHVQMN